MSRCFPYPPPGYEKSAALIESLKKERLKSEKDKKDKKEKGKKKDKKEKRSKSKSEEKKHRSKKRHREDSSKSTTKKLTTDEDRSSLTEEHDSPSISRDRKKICRTFEPTTQEQEIKKQETKIVLNSNVSESSGGFKIRLTRPKEEELLAVAEQPCFSGRRTDEERIQQPEPGFLGRQKEEVKEKKRKRKSCDESSSSRDWDRQRKRLMRDWNPPPLVPSEEEDLDWLLGAGAPARRQTRTVPPPSPAVIVDGPPCRATYIAEAGIYALPYAVPF